MAGRNPKREAAPKSFARAVTGLVAEVENEMREVVNEARETAIKQLGFEPGPDLCERIREENSWWVEVQGIDAYDAKESGESIGRGPRWARAACVAALEELLSPCGLLCLAVAEDSLADLKETAQSIEDFLMWLRKYSPKAGGPPSPKAIAAFREKRLAEQRMAELERQLAEARCQNTVA